MSLGVQFIIDHFGAFIMNLIYRIFGVIVLFCAFFSHALAQVVVEKPSAYKMTWQEVQKESGFSEQVIKSYANTLYETMVAEAGEAFSSRLENKSISLANLQSNTKSAQVASVIELLCKKHNTTSCPKVYVSQSEFESSGVMSASGVLYVNESFLANFNPQEIAFFSAHEMAHFYFQHTLKKSWAIAKEVFFNKMNYYSDEQKVLGVFFMIGDMRGFLKDIETEADSFALNQTLDLYPDFNCKAMMLSIKERLNVQGRQENSSEHLSINNRC